MKGILVIIDGMGDLPCKSLKGKTPLEAADTPNLDYLAGKGKLGYMYPIKEGVAPESDSAILSILGNKFLQSYRGQLEVLGTEMEMDKGDLAVRTNFATVDNLKNKEVKDRRAGRTLSTKEASVLAKAINENVSLQCKFAFKNTVQHRGVLILKGGFSDNITNTDPEYHSGKSNKFKFAKPLDEDENSEFTSNVINEFIDESYKVLSQHPVNKAREKKGLMPANIILTRDASTNLPDLKRHKSWASIVNMPLELGISKASKMTPFSFSYPKMRGCDVYKNLYRGLKKACRFSKKILRKKGKDFNYFYIHFKETDIPGHDNKPHEKKKMLEVIDKMFFKYLRKLAKKEKTKILVTADHSTPCNLKVHSSDPVPVLLCDWKGKSKKKFSEKSSKKGKLGKMYGKDILRLLKKRK